MERFALVFTLIVFLFTSCVSCVTHINRVIMYTSNVPQIKLYMSVARVVTMPNEETGEHDGISGTAWAIDNDHMVTAGHVCESATETNILKKTAKTLRLQQHGFDGLLLDEEIFATIVAYDPVKDICLLLSPDHPFLPLMLAEDTELVETEDPVFTVGAPRHTFPTRTEGHVIQIRAENWSGKYKHMIFLKLDIDHGSSGGPVMWGGQVIGMTVILPNFPHHAALAVPAEQLQEFLKKHIKLK